MREMIRKRRIALVVAALSIGSHHCELRAEDPNEANARASVPNSTIQPAELLSSTYAKWLTFVESKYKCKQAKVISAQPIPMKTPGVISERWQATVCDRPRTFALLLIPDGAGGYLVSFRP